MAKNKKMAIAGTSLVVQLLGLHVSNVGGMGSIPGQRTKILRVTQWDLNK